MATYTEKEIEAIRFVPTQQEYFTGKAWLKNYVFSR